MGAAMIRSSRRYTRGLAEEDAAAAAAAAAPYPPAIVNVRFPFRPP